MRNWDPVDIAAVTIAAAVAIAIVLAGVAFLLDVGVCP